MKLCFIDIETTGLNEHTEKIWQIAGSIRNKGRIVHKFNFVDKRNEKRLFLRFLVMLDKYVNKYDTKDKMFFIGYNAIFDSNFIRRMFLTYDNEYFGSYFYNPYICVMQMAARYFMKNSRKKRPDNFKLGTVCRYFKIRVSNSKLHDADYDADLTKKLYNKLYKLT